MQLRNPLPLYFNINEGDVVGVGEDSWLDSAIVFDSSRSVSVVPTAEEECCLEIIEAEAKHKTPERNLLASVFMFALADVSQEIARDDKYEMAEIIANSKSAFNWFESDDGEYAFSFRNICRELNISYQTARKIARKNYNTYLRRTFA